MNNAPRHALRRRGPLRGALAARAARATHRAPPRRRRRRATTRPCVGSGGDDASTHRDGSDGRAGRDAAPVDDVSVSTRPCFTTFRYVPPPGTTPHAVVGDRRVERLREPRRPR